MPLSCKHGAETNSMAADTMKETLVLMRSDSDTKKGEGLRVSQDSGMML